MLLLFRSSQNHSTITKRDWWTESVKEGPLPERRTTYRKDMRFVVLSSPNDNTLHDTLSSDVLSWGSIFSNSGLTLTEYELDSKAAQEGKEGQARKDGEEFMAARFATAMYHASLRTKEEEYGERVFEDVKLRVEGAVDDEEWLVRFEEVRKELVGSLEGHGFEMKHFDVENVEAGGRGEGMEEVAEAA